MTNEDLNRAKVLICLLHTSQKLLDELPVQKFFKHKLKYTCTNFSVELEKFLESFYHNMDEEANLLYNKHVQELESFLEEYAKGNVRVEESGPEFQQLN